jgi:hypothetical protein
MSDKVVIEFSVQEAHLVYTALLTAAVISHGEGHAEQGRVFSALAAMVEDQKTAQTNQRNS